MSSPFTDLQSLAVYLRTLVQKPAPVVLDSSILDPAVANEVSQAFALGSGALAINGLSAADIPAPANNALQVVVASTMPNSWQFTDSFASLSIFPFDSLTVANGASFVFSSIEQPS